MRFSLRHLLAAAAVASITACLASSCTRAPASRPADATQARVSAADSSNAPQAPDARAPSRARIAPPTPGRVIEAIFEKPGDRSDSYEVDNGSRATYWYGQAYDVAAQHYFTGFVAQSPDHFGKAADAEDPPAARATLTQATFKSGSAAEPWTVVAAQHSVGEFGARGQADGVDGSRKAEIFSIGSGRIVLAVPTDAPIEQGTVQKNYEVVVRASDGAWSYAGTVPAGVDDSAGCDQGRAFPCAAMRGRLEFVPGSSMPDIEVTLQPLAPVKKSAGSKLVYRLDPKSSLYQPIR